MCRVLYYTERRAALFVHIYHSMCTVPNQPTNASRDDVGMANKIAPSDVLMSRGRGSVTGAS